jgi:hypothetical protein
MKYSILIFESMHKVMKTEKILLAEGIGIEIIPTPKEITSECGMSIRVNPEKVDLHKIKSILKNNNMDYHIFEKEMI